MEIKNFTMYFDTFPPLSCQVPCTMYGTLLEHGLIEDPFWRMNEQKYTALSEKDCVFESHFPVDAATLHKDHVYLEFYGLDTLCNIYLNGKKLAYTSDMHRFYSFDVKEKLACGDNTLRLEFLSPTAYAAAMNNKCFLWHNPDTIPGAAHLRKSICMFGWDWAPKLPDMGIFRKIELNAYNTDKIEDISVLQHHKHGTVELEIAVTTRHHSDSEIYFSIAGQQVKLENGTGTLTIENPKLWWVRGYGEQYLYNAEVTLVHAGKTIDTATKKIGLRTLEVSTQRDKDDDSCAEFCFVNNGVKIFAMGANYVPQDSLISRISPERTRKLLMSCADANHNCIRVWGGGYYPEDEFFDICDELGIIVWQDFMSACYSFWFHSEFKENYIQEAIYNIKRIRLHPSLGLFCGNNEIEWKFKLNPELFGSQRLLQDYVELFERILPELCNRYAPKVFYWPSSPSSGGCYLDVDKEEIGDTHFYSPVADYENHKFRFCSEYGFEAFPPMKTIESFSEEADRNPFSRVMDFHQKSRGGNKIIVQNLSDNYLMPYRFDTFVYASQLFQADEVDRAVQHFRRIRGICMGSLYWQLNDTAPVASWASLDYFGRYKALHYASKRFYAPVTLGLFSKENTVTVNLSNETRNHFNGTLSVKLCRNDLSVMEEETIFVHEDALTSSDVFIKTYHPEDPYSNYVVATLYGENGEKIFQKTALFVKPKHFTFRKPNISVEIEKTDDRTAKATVKSDALALRVYFDFAGFDCVLSDNFFDIATEDAYEVTFKTDATPEDIKKHLQILSVYDIGIPENN